jgi:uncharacterized membrane protein
MTKLTRSRYSALLGVAVVAMALSPVIASAATSSAGTTVTATVSSTISVSTSAAVGFSITPIAGGSQSSSSDTVTVNTNNSTGYYLTLADADAATTLTSGANSILTGAGTQAAPVALANNSWGYRVDNTGGFGAGPTTTLTNASSSTQTFAGMPASGSPNTLKTTATTASGDTTTVWYSAKVDTSKPSGAYVDSVTYTATTNP